MKLTSKNRYWSAPLAGFSDIAWRIIVREFGAGVVFSEMISVEGLKRRHKRTFEYVKNDPRARPFCIQLFGSKPESFADAIDALEGEAFDMVDINMGCPVKKVIKSGAGSALMKTPKTAAAIVSAVRKKYKGDLTVKIRSGWDSNTINAVEFAHIAEVEGADAVIVHPRTSRQGFTGEADWKIIKDVKDHVGIRVIGNGDVTDKSKAEKLFRDTNCDGIMIGRAALLRPWIFGELAGERFVFGANELSELIKKHFRLLLEFYTERYAVVMMRKFLPKYLKGMRSAKELIAKVQTSLSAREFNRFVEEFFVVTASPL